MSLLYLVHILVFATLLGYIGLVRDKLPNFIYPVLLSVGVFVVAYHIYKSLFKKDAWVNYIHVIFIGPLLIYIGWNKEKSSTKAFDISIMVAGATFGYHLYRLIKTW